MRHRPCLALLAIALPAAAAAQDEPPPPEPLDIPCVSRFATQVRIDGLQVDWDAEAQPADRIEQLAAGAWRYDYVGPADASFRAWCRYTGNGLYFAVVGRDDALVAPEHRSDGDRLQLMFDLDPDPDDTSIAVVEIPLWPALEDGVSTVTFVRGPDGEVTAARAEVATRDTGWFAEISIPWIALDGVDEPLGPIPFAIAHVDWDHDVDDERESIIASAPVAQDRLGRLVPDGAARRIADVQRALAVDTDPQLPRFGNVVADGRDEWIGIIGDHLVVTGLDMGGNTTWLATSVRTTSDHLPEAIDLHDLDHDGDNEILYRWSRTITPLDGSAPVRQELVAAWDVTPDGITRLFAQEVANQRDGGFDLAMQMELRERSDHTTVRFRLTRGEDASRHDYVDIDADEPVDYRAMILPWTGPPRIDWEPGAGGTWEAITQ